MTSKPKYKVGDILKNSKGSVLQITSMVLRITNIIHLHESGFDYECFAICWDGYVIPSISFYAHELQLNFDLIEEPEALAFFLLKLENYEY